MEQLLGLQKTLFWTFRFQKTVTADHNMLFSFGHVLGRLTNDLVDFLIEGLEIHRLLVDTNVLSLDCCCRQYEQQ